MAKYDVTHSCGHTVEITLFGPHAERDRRREWLRSQPCTACQSARAAEAASEAGLPKLVGSPKQVAWAETIRAKALAEVELRLNMFSVAPAEAEAVKRAASYLRAETSARWWIDNRYCGEGFAWLRAANRAVTI